MIDSRHLIIICFVCGLIGCLIYSGQCHRPLSTNVTQQQQQQIMHQSNAKNGFQLHRTSSQDNIHPDYQPDRDSQSPAYSLSSSSSLSGRYFSSNIGNGSGRGSSGGIAAIALAAPSLNAPTTGNSAYQPNRGRKHAFTDLRKNLTSQGRLWERQGDDPERNDHNNNPMKILKNKILKSDVSIFQNIDLSNQMELDRLRPTHYITICRVIRN